MSTGITPANDAAAAHLQRLGIAAAEELRQAVRSTFTTLMREFVTQCPAAYTAVANKVTNTTEKNEYQTLATVMTVKAARWVETFCEHLDAHLIGGELPERPPTDLSQTITDNQVTMANVELHAETRYHKRVTELAARVNRLRLMLYVPVYTRALAPAGLCRALDDTATALDWPSRKRGLLFEQFDRIVVPKLEGAYQALIEAVTRIGSNAAVATGETAKPIKPPKRPKKSAATIAAPANSREIDPESVAMLQSFALKSDGTGYTDSLLAADLLALADHRPLPGVAKDQSWVPLQRIAVAGHFLNEVISDSMVPDELKAQHESVRFPLMKSALTDESLFTSVAHPLSSLVNELLLKSATSRITGSAETRRVAELLQQVLTQFDLAPEFVRQALDHAKPIEDSQIHRFFELQRQQAQQRREFVIAEAKRLVVKQIETLIFGRGVPPQATRFLLSAWGPLMTKRMLQHGADHVLTKAGLALMEQLLDQLDARKPDQPPPAEWLELAQTMGKALIAEGMAEETVRGALANLEAARRAPPGEIA